MAGGRHRQPGLRRATPCAPGPARSPSWCSSTRSWSTSEPSSELTVERTGTRQAVRAARSCGSPRARSRPGSAPTAMTRRATRSRRRPPWCAPQSTNFIVRYDPAEKATDVVGVEGTVAVQGTTGIIGPGVAVAPNETTRVPLDGFPSPARALDAAQASHLRARPASDRHRRRATVSTATTRSSTDAWWTRTTGRPPPRRRPRGGPVPQAGRPRTDPHRQPVARHPRQQPAAAGLPRRSAEPVAGSAALTLGAGFVSALRTPRGRATCSACQPSTISHDRGRFYAVRRTILTFVLLLQRGASML